MKKIVNIFASILLMFMVCPMVQAQEPAAATYSYEQVSFCHGGSVTYKGRVYTEQGKDTLKYQSSTGGDSLVVLTINEYPNYHFDQTVHIQQDSSYNWMGSTYSKTGTYTKIYTSVYGCDSIYTLNLIVDQSYAFHDSASVCLGEIYEWQGKKINEEAAGKYQYEVNYISQWGVDSTYYLTLTVLPTPHSQKVLVFCPGGDVTFMGKIYSQAGRDVITVPSVTGCDSTIEVIIKANPSYHFNDTIHIKEGSSYTWHGETYDQTGTYELPFKTIEGCDSVYTLTLFVDPSYTVNQDTTVCFGESFSWNNLYINATEAGEKDYKVTLQSIYGTDSIINLHVTVLPRIVEYKQLYFCHGGGVTYNGHTYTQAGRDTLTYQSHLGCDSLLVLTIYENPSYQFFDTIYLAKGETISWHNLSITEFKTYTDSYQTVNGCDSTYTLVVYEKPTYNFYQDTTICFGDAFEWHNQKISEEKAGTYSYTANYTSQYGTDSIYHLNVTILPKYWMIQQLFFCEGSKAYYGGKTYTQSGRDTLRYTSALGCDSIVEVIVNFKNPIYFKDTIQLEEGTTLEWRGQTISAAGTYKDEYGCDSIFTLFVQLVHVDHIYQNATICEGETYVWEGQTYSATGDYIASYKNQAGNDSIMHLHLTVNPKSWVIKHFALCQGGTIEYNGKTYHKAGRDTLIFTSTLGCDSVEEVIVIETYPFHHYDTLRLEAGTTTQWHGQTISTGGIYKDENTTVSGCDSIYELYVQLYYVDHIYKDTTICYGETYTWEGENFNVSGEYVREKRFTNQAGTDSIMHLHLVILPEYKIIKAFNLCQGSTIEYNGKTYDKAGRDTVSFTSSHGCDSIVEVIVTETYPFHQYDTIKLEAGTTTQWHGQTISTGGTYKDEHTTVAGCDSIYELYVQLYYVDHIYKDTTICYGETYTWQGNTYKEPGEYIREKAFKNVSGTDSIMHLHLVILPENKTTQTLTFCHGKSVTFNGKTYTRPGRDTIYTTASTGCDSIIEIIITESPIYAFYDTITIWDTETYSWRGQTITGSGEYKDEYVTASGCDSTYYLKVYVQHKDDIHETATICYGETYTWQGNTYSEVGTHHYEVTYTNQYGNDSTMHLHLTILPKYWQQLPLFFCHGSSVTFNGKTYSTEGKDTLRFNSINGCDSIVELIVKEYPTYLYQDTVHIKSDSVITWHGMTIDHEGTFEDRQYTIYGCDSIYRLTVIEDVVYNFYEKASICTGQTLEWQGLTIKRQTQGVYNYHRKYTSVLGTDSIYHLELTVTPSYFEQKQFYICPGSSVTFLGHVYTQSGRDTIQLFSSTGCDSLIEVLVAEYPSYHYDQTVHIKKDSSYTWNGKVFTQSGKYYDSYSTIHGCDSTYTLTLIVDSAYTFHDSAFSCLGDIYEWQGLKINEATAGKYNYKVNYTTQYGMDSTYYLTLTIHEKPFTQQIISICPGENVTFHNRNYSKAGRDTILLPSVTGCDSIIEVIINEYESYRFNDTVHIKKDSSYTWHDQQYSQTGTYVIQGSTIHGCDSTYTLTLIVDSAYHFYEKADLCVNEVYEWQGLIISKDSAGVYTYIKPYTSIYGMDSVYHLTIDIHPVYKAQQHLYFCAGDSVAFHGKMYKQPGKDTIHLQSFYGCDSLIEVIVNEYPTYHFQETKYIKEGDTFEWQGKTITEEGVYDAHYNTVNGCDSSYTLKVIKIRDYEYWETAHSCVGETFLWQGLEINEKAVGTYEYTQKYVSQFTTDSVYHLTLTIDSAYVQYQYLSFCEGGSVTFGDSTYTQSGTDTLRFKAIGGCDSTIIVVINAQKRFFTSDTIELSNQQTYLWHGQSITQTGTYHDVQTTASGCDSIYELVAFFYPTYLFEDSIAICQSEAPYIWRLNETTEIPLIHEIGQTKIYEQRYETVNHKDSVYRIILTIHPEYEINITAEICEGDRYSFGGKSYDSTGTYSDTLQTIYGCDSIVRLHLNVMHKYLRIDTAYLSMSHPTYTWSANDSTFLTPTVYDIVTKTTSGCDSINRLVLLQAQRYVFPIEHDTLCSSGNDAIVWHNKTLTESGIYYDSLFTSLGEDSIYSIELAVFPTYDTTLSVTLCEVELPYMFNNRIKCTETGTYLDTLQTIHGCDSVVRLELNVLPRVFESTVETICETDLAAGYYFHGYKIINEGMYAVPLQSETQCGSVAELFLRLKPDLMESDSVVICAGDTYVLGRAHDPEISEDYNGITVSPKKDTVIWGCDDIHYFKIFVRNAKDTTVNMCENDSLWLPGTKRWVFPVPNAVYTDTIKTNADLFMANPDSILCDSLVRWTIGTIYPTYHPDTVVMHISDHDSILWGGKYRTAAGIYNDTTKTAACGCDSIVTLRLFVDKTYSFRDSIHICQPHDVAYQHTWTDGHVQSQAIWNEGVYTDSLRTTATADLYKYYARDYKDSVYTLVVTMDPSYFFPSTITLCQGDSIELGGKWITKAGVYTDSLTTQLGCDSIYRWVVNMTQSYYFRETKSIAQGTIYTWHGRQLDAPGTYYDSLQTTTFGCDSIYELTLTVYPTYHYITDTVICACQTPFLWHNQMLYETGIYYDRQQTIHRFDSIYELRLQVKDTSHVRINASTCEGDSIFFDNTWIKQAGVYYDTLTNAFGCDSIIEFVYTQKQKYLFEQTETTDDQHPFIWAGHKDEHGEDMVFTTSGLYQDKQKTIDGCDSIYRLTLTVYPTYRDTVKETICSNDSYYWRGNYYNETGCYTDALKTKAGYDSIFVLNLTVLPISYGTERLMICQGDSMEYYGKIYKTQGTYYDTLTSRVTGCDSIVSIIVTITPKYYFKESAQTDDQHSYIWMNHKGNIAYNRTGVYYDSLQTVTGCDSIYELTLTVYPTYHFDTIRQTICASEAPYYWAEGQRDCANSGIYTARYSTVNGYDSIYVLDLTVNPTLHGEWSVSICEGDSFPWNGTQLTKGGNYIDTLYSPLTGCDSIVTLHLFVKKTYFIQHNQTIYAGDTAFFEGDTLLYGGLYEKRYQSSDTTHCDSIIQLNLIVKPTYYRDTTVSICESELPYRWNWHNNEAFYAGGTYIRTSITDEGRFCDTLHLNVDEQHMKTIQTFICEGDTLYYRDKMYASSGSFYDTIPAVSGCDTILKIVVGVYPESKQYLTVHISEKQKPYLFDGRELDKSGTYYNYEKNMFGCDSVTILTLVVHPSIKDSTYMEVCDNELPYIFSGRKLWQSGLYTDSLYTKEGYDSIVVLNLKVLPSYLIEESYTIKAGTHTFIHDLDISAPGIYYDSLRTISGCDSVFKIIVNYPRTWKQEYDVSICQGETFKFYGAEYTQTGTYRYTSPMEDSIVIAHLTVHETKFTRIEKLLCSDGDSLFFFHGKELKAPIIYRDTFKTFEGCDSIVILDLKITEKFSEWDQRPLCKGDTVIIQGDTITHPGDYELLRKSKSGKNDSIYRVSYYEAPNFEVSITDTICQGDTLWVGSIPVTRAGLQTLNPKTVDGCDSIVHLNLVINPSYFKLEKATTVDYIPYQWRGKSYNESGTYYDILPTIHNCDSTFALELKVIDTYRIPEDREICIGSTTLWRGKEYSEPGFYADTICNIASYTSIIYTLNLSIVIPTEIQSATVLTQEVCADAHEMVMNVQHTGATPQTYSVYFDARAHHEGFEDILDASFITPGVITIPIPEMGVPAYQNHMRYVRPDNYAVIIELNNGVCGVAKSNPVQFQVRYPSWILEQNWSNVVAVLAKDYNGGFEFNQYAWRINNAPMEGTEAYIRNDFLAVGDSVMAYLTRVGEDYSIPTCPLIIAAPAPDAYSTPVLQVEPTSAPVTCPRFVIQSQMGGHYNVYTMMGQPLGQGDFEQGQHVLMLPAMAGHYVIYVSQEDGTSKAQHVIVY